jgi:hypothetical protein
MENTSIKSLETAIRSQLKSLGYFSIEIQDENENEKSFNVIADGNLRKIFIKVLVQLVSDHIMELTSEQIMSIKDNAKTIKKEPWAAIMRVNDKGELIENIHWRNLSKQST